MIIKAENPWHSSKNVLIFAGIRGIGTWGAAECLRNEWKKIYDLKRSDGKHSKRGNFVTLVKVCLKKGDIIELNVERMIDLD